MKLLRSNGNHHYEGTTTMFNARLYAAASLACTVILLIGLLGAAAAGARPVALHDARVAPTVLHYLPVGAHVTYAHGRYGVNCKSHRQEGFFSDVSAYRWNGSPLSSQHYDRKNAVAYWLDRRHGGEVVFDGITFWNHTHRPVIVAGWCENIDPQNY